MQAIAIQGPFTPDELWDGLIPDEHEKTVEAIQTRVDDIREAQDAWTKLNRCLHRLGPLPPDVLEGWDRIKPWLNQQGQNITLSLVHQRQMESDVVWRWS